MESVRFVILLGLALFLGGILAGCGGGGEATQASFPALSPEDAISKTYAAMILVDSYRSEGTIKIMLEGETSEGTLETEFVAPDRIHMKGFDIEGGWLESVHIGNVTYNRDSGKPDWRKHDMDLPGVGEDTFLGYSFALEPFFQYRPFLVDLRQLPDETVYGVDCLHYDGQVDMVAWIDDWKTKLDPPLEYYEEWLKELEWLARSEITLELWIGKGDYLIQRTIRFLVWLTLRLHIICHQRCLCLRARSTP